MMKTPNDEVDIFRAEWKEEEEKLLNEYIKAFKLWDKLGEEEGVLATDLLNAKNNLMKTKRDYLSH